MKHGVWLLIVLVCLAVPSPARADIAPPSNPPGANPGPESETTQVRMVSESVLLEVLADAPSDSLGRARVTADFTMRNLGADSETMAVRFPVGANDGSNNYPEIQDIRVWVDGQSVRTRRTEGPSVNWSEEIVPWAEFDVTFPPGEDVPVRVSYTLEATGEDPFMSFYYILETGAGWRDSIGSADVIVRLPYAANAQNVILDLQIGWAETSPGSEFSGDEIRWHFEDLEPGPEHNLEVALVKPAVWLQILEWRAAVERNPKDGEAWGQLGKATKEAIRQRRGLRPDAGGEELYALSIQAYDKAVTLLPKDALWHAGYADLLAEHAYWEGFGGRHDARAETLLAMQELHTALALAPRNARVAEIAESISWLFSEGIQSVDGGYAFPWLTATPTFVAATDFPTATVPATQPAPATSVPAIATTTTPTPQTEDTGDEPTPASAPTGGAPSPCGSVAMVAVPLGALVVTHWRRRTR
jgi:hypothetical protein